MIKEIQIRNYKFYFALSVIAILIFTGCGTFDLGSQSSSLVKVRCRQQTPSKPISININQQEQFSENDNKNKNIKDENLFTQIHLNDSVSYSKKATFTQNLLSSKNIHLIIKKVSNPIITRNATYTKTASINTKSKNCRAENPQDGLIGLLSLFFTTIGLIMIIMPNTATMTFGVILCLVAVILASVAVESDNDADEILGGITIGIWSVITSLWIW